MASKPIRLYTEENTYYARICRTIVELCRDALWETLLQKIPPKDIPGVVVLNLHKLQNLHADIKAKFKDHDAKGTTPTNEDVDLTALYTLFRNIFPKSKLKAPKNGWGSMPGQNDIKEADDIERIRQYRNSLYGHITKAALTLTNFSKYAKELKDLFKRFDSRLGSKYENVFDNYMTCEMDPKLAEEYKRSLQQQIEYDKETRTQVVELKQKVEDIQDEMEDIKGGLEQIRESDDVITSLKEQQTKTEGKVTDMKLKQEKQEECQQSIKEDLALVKEEQHMAKGKPDINIHVYQDKCNKGARPKTRERKTELSCDKRSEVTVGTKEDNAMTQQVIQKRSYSDVLTAKIRPKATRRLQSDEQDPRCNIQVNVTNVNVTQLAPTELEQVPVKIQYASLKSAVNDFKDGHFVLICCQMERQKYMEHLAFVPWTVVFDLDKNSRTAGLLSVVEERLNSVRSLYVHSLFDKTTNITESSTHWFFMQNPNSTNMPCDFGAWNKDSKVSGGLKSIISNMKSFSSTYTSFRIVLFWPPDEEYPRYVERILQKLEKHFEPEVVVLDSNENKTPYSSSILSNFKKDLKERLKHINLTIEDVCYFIQSSLSRERRLSERQFILPVSKVAMECNIDQRQASWLQEVLDVLFEDKQFDTTNIIARTLEMELDNFYKGGTLPWYIRYELGSDVDAERDVMKEILRQIRQLKEEYKSKVIRINHAPGCGGTTIGQRILWEMREALPCVQVKPRESYMISEIEQRLELLYKKTDLPVLVMLDGEDEHKVNEMINSLEHISLIALCVNRYPYPMTKKGFWNDEYWLDTYVSHRESNTIALKLGQQCRSKTKKEKLDKLNEDVRDGKKIAIFEFGLAAYAHEYAGIASYVSGFLRLEQQKTELEPWQNALAILSFAYYYGQSGMPCQFFTELLKLGTQRVPNIHDFPKEMQALIVPDTADRKQNVVRISHYFIAKEILEQLLPRPHPRSDTRTPHLNLEDKRDLENFAISVIKHAENVDRKTNSHTISTILSKSFISRDSKLSSDGRGHHEKRKRLLSPLLSDLENKQPFTSRFNVYNQLVKSFPNEARFHAQLGRLYTLLKPEMEEAAEKHFRKALDLCKDKIAGRSVDDIPRFMRLTLMMTNHMFGRMFKTRVEKVTGKSASDKPTLPKQESFVVVTRRLLGDVTSACECYRLCRKYNPEHKEDFKSYEQEISTRLLFCEFVSRNSDSKNVLKFLQEEEKSPMYKDICDFLKDCIQEIDCLFLEYFSSWADPDDIDPSFRTYQIWYTSLFKKNSPGYILQHDNSIQTRRLRIAQLKINTGVNDEYGDLLKIDNVSEILSIIRDYEHNFDDYHKSKQQCSKRDIDIDYREWLVAIRHDKITEPKSVEEVLQVVEYWYRTLNTPTARLYVFILKSILGFGTSGYQGNTRLLLDAKDLRMLLSSQSKYMPHSRKPREWLGTDDGIRCLELGSRYTGQRDRSINRVDLALFKGTICYPNKNPRSGAIKIDLGHGSSVDVRAFFVPLKACMGGASFAGRRVEFNIAFSYYNGYEAFFASPLAKVKCPKCGLSIEITSRDVQVTCPPPCQNAFTINN